jgi:hypothetical protein
MRRLALLASAALSWIPCTAWSASYAEELERVKAREKKIDWNLTQLGVGGRASSNDAAEKEEASKLPLLQVYSQAAALRAPAGKLLFAKLHTRVVVSSESAPVVGLLDGGQGLFSALRVLGKARPSSTPGRLQIEWDRVVTRGGRTIAVHAVALDPEGALGLTAQVFSNKALAVTGALASSFISGLVASQQSMAPGALGFSETPPTGRNALLQGTAQTAADQSKRLLDEATQEKPVLIVEPGTAVTLYLEEEVRF